jgi:hypothetical protein
MIERLTPFFVDTIEVHAAKIVKTHVLLFEQVSPSLSLTPLFPSHSTFRML